MALRYTLGIDVGSSSVKASLLDIERGVAVAGATSPDGELPIVAHRPGWAEQHPDLWWEHVAKATALLRDRVGAEAMADIGAVGITYQMHGLVALDADGVVVRPAIIWCDSRAVPYGEAAFDALGHERVLSRVLNSPGNFTASKLAWVKEHEPEVFAKIRTIMLPGDYITYRLTGEKSTTISGLSEAILWDAKSEEPAGFLLNHFGFDAGVLPPHLTSFAESGRVTEAISREIGIPAGVPVTYRAGDQPNNAFSLGVIEPGRTAATAGTSGVVYGVVGSGAYDPKSRVNTFVHVSHTVDRPRYGVLLCVNGTGILNSWLRRTVAEGLTYEEMNRRAADSPIGAKGLVVLPYGNGAERPLENRDPGASVRRLNFNVHDRSDLLRAGQEGIVFALNYGLEVMAEIGVETKVVRAGHANMFLSPVFREAFANTCKARVELYNTDGAAGAARGAAVGAGVYTQVENAFAGLEAQETIEPTAELERRYGDAYGIWREELETLLR